MKLLLDSTRCQGYGLCQEPAPELIDLDEWGYAGTRTAEVPPGDEEAAAAAVAACPNSALRLVK
ncbi:ferredoxin [Streptomyces collinus]|uniref:Ferredoxin n=1 Tax=Streptomyces collinus (strain DSM 40733 / Tue 365) TaxID=1214242 RepID=S5VAC6_STRC3|nr:ferredoxin [Streptomyces collinus]AGS67467.1 ferredoxin [Streptomyces collinus Tu 365]UJA06148.1 ferredoxin [Streptomyces collinus]UJA12682.1 ferredoxin [Streptomyces collinus]